MVSYGRQTVFMRDMPMGRSIEVTHVSACTPAWGMP
jgi:hypothetical protein